MFASDYRPKLIKMAKADRTLTGKLDVQTGAVYRVWSFVFKIRHTEADSNYATISEIETMFKYVNPQGTPSSTLTLYAALDSNSDGVGDGPYSVVFMGEFAPENLTPMLHGTEGWFTIPVELEEVDPQ